MDNIKEYLATQSDIPQPLTTEQMADIKSQFHPSNTANVNIVPYEIYDEDGEEQVVGEVRKTIDGVKKKKPVYKNFILIPSLPSSAGSQTYTSDITNADDIICFYGCTQQEGDVFYPLNICRNNTEDQIGCRASIENNTIKITYIVGYTRANCAGKIFVEYTKNTDTWEEV